MVTKDYNSLVENLHAAGALVEHPVSPQVIIQDFSSITGQVVKVNREDIQVFEYGDESTAETEVALVSPDGSSISTSMPF